MGAAAVILLFLLYFAFSFGFFVLTLRVFMAFHKTNAFILALALLVPSILAALPHLQSQPRIFTWEMARMALYVLMPTILLVARPATDKPLDLFDIAAILSLWLPVEFGWLPDLSVRAAGIDLPIPMLTAICLGLFLFLVVRHLDNIGYTFRLHARDIGVALLALAVYAAVGLPLGLALGFIQPGLAVFEPVAWLVKFLAIYFFTAIPEELLFRGVIQNLIEQRFGRDWMTLSAAAIIFGLSHINNVTAHYAPPNWPYVIMATLAGLAYGWTWRSREKITASAITHTMVNFIWGVVFRS